MCANNGYEMRYVCYLTTLTIAKVLECGWLVNEIDNCGAMVERY